MRAAFVYPFMENLSSFHALHEYKVGVSCMGILGCLYHNNAGDKASFLARNSQNLESYSLCGFIFMYIPLSCVCVCTERIYY